MTYLTERLLPNGSTILNPFGGAHSLPRLPQYSLQSIPVKMTIIPVDKAIVPVNQGSIPVSSALIPANLVNVLVVGAGHGRRFRIQPLGMNVRPRTVIGECFSNYGLEGWSARWASLPVVESNEGSEKFRAVVCRVGLDAANDELVTCDESFEKNARGSD